MKISDTSGSGCSKLTMLLINVSLKFQIISDICQYFLLQFDDASSSVEVSKQSL